MRLKLLEAFDFVSNPEESLEKLTDLTLHRELINRQMRRILARLRKHLKWL
jgi:copper homeostasis protein CutC